MTKLIHALGARLEYVDLTIAIVDLENEYTDPVNEYADQAIAIADLGNEYVDQANEYWILLRLFRSRIQEAKPATS